MKETKKLSHYIVFALGILLVCLGLVGLIYGPMEIYCFYLFSPGGPFNYPDFGVGSLWFGYLLVQNLGYYAVAAVFLPLGWGYISQQRWAFVLTKLYLWTWIIAGIYILLNLLAAFPNSYVERLISGLTSAQVILLGIAAVFVLIGLPILFLIAAQRTKILEVLSQSSDKSHWLEMTPTSILGLYFCYLLLIMGLHILIFFQSLIPTFGSVMVGRPPVYVITVLVTLAVLILFGLLKRNKYALVTSILFTSLMLISTLMSFWSLNLTDLFDLMTLPPTERIYLKRLPLLNQLKPLVIYGYPLVVMLILTVSSWKYFFQAYHAPQNRSFNLKDKDYVKKITT